MELHQIRYFLAACDEMNFTRAAQSTGVSQPALTKAIQKLEENLGGALFIRSTRRLELTELGRTMRKHLSKIEETCQSARQAAREFSSQGPTELNVGLMCTLGPNLIMPALMAFHEQSPEINLVLHDISNHQADDLIRAGGLDCVLMTEYGKTDTGLSWTPLFKEDICLAMSDRHPVANKPEGFVLTDLSDLNFIDRLTCEFRQDFINDLNLHNIQLNIAIRAERDDWIQATLLSGDYATLLPAFSSVMEGIKLHYIKDYPKRRLVGIKSRADHGFVFSSLNRLTDFLTDWKWRDAAREMELAQTA